MKICDDKKNQIFGNDAKLTEIYLNNKCSVTLINKKIISKKFSFSPKAKKYFHLYQSVELAIK